MTQATVKPGDFTGLAQDYSKSRPDYCPVVLQDILELTGKPINEIDFVDIGAGTGIWTRMVSNAGVKTSTAIEPNDDMRKNGIQDSTESDIKWLKGNAEHSGIEAGSCDLLTMASSFHWADFDKATHEFHRILRAGGKFCALWNPRLIEVNPLLLEIEQQLHKLKPNLNRVSSGRSGLTEVLTDKLNESPFFENIVYLEGTHVIEMSVERYLSAWRSVNDLQAQLGVKKFEEFFAFIEEKVSSLTHIEATYLTRAWVASRKE